MKSQLSKYFLESVMSVHLKENMKPLVKVGRPGAWDLQVLEHEEALTRTELESLISELLIVVEHSDTAFLEQESKYVKVLQIDDMRTVITFPPLSKEIEITVVRPIKRLALGDYDLDPKLLERFKGKAEGVLIAGAPGNGKSTFAQALCELYYAQNKIIKTIEVPRDLHVPAGVTQYSLSHSSTNTIRDLLLLTRPDYTFFDEIRNPEDFVLFKDLRLTGIGMVGVVHAERAIDAIQRCIGKIELGMIAHVIDTVIFIKDGGIAEVYTLTSTVKVPVGMTDSDLSRPVIMIYDFFTEKELFEIYTFSDQVVVIDIPKAKKQSEEGINELSQRLPEIKRKLSEIIGTPYDIEVLGASSISVRMDDREIPSFIGKGGANIQKLEKTLGIHIDVQKKEGIDPSKLVSVKFDVVQGRKSTEIVPKELMERGILYVDERRKWDVVVGPSGRIKIQKGMMASVVQRGGVKLLKVR